MPELPEVETIRLSLAPLLIGRKIVGIKAYLPKMINVTVSELTAAVTGQTIEEVGRRGKYLLLRLSGHQVLALHLRMTGQLTVVPDITEAGKATYFIVELDNQTELRFNDTRKFGRVLFYREDQLPAGLQKLGPEPLAPDFTPDLLRKRFNKRELAVKKGLLNQEIVAGIGNIYADEALFLAGIHPTRPVNTLTNSEINKLVYAIQKVLQEGIDHRGTTKRDYLDGQGHPGSHQEYLRVYGRKGLPCFVCNTPIAKINLGGRGTHFCPNCQGGVTKVIGLTGGIASGKSTVCNILKERGIPVTSADDLAHQAIRKGTRVYQQIIEKFGSDLLLEDGEIDRRKLGKIIFANPRLRKELEELIHPVVIEQIETMIRTGRSTNCPMMVFEIPLLFEAGMEHLFDEVWVISVAPAVQEERLKKRNHFTEDEAKKRIAAQMPLSLKEGKADRIINNNGGLDETRTQIYKILSNFGV